MAKKEDEQAPDLTTPAGRLKWFAIVAYGGLPQFIAKNEFNASQIYRVAKGGSIPKLDYCAVIGEKGLNLHWWGTGDGPWYAPNAAGERLAKKVGTDAPTAAPLRSDARVKSVASIAQPNEIARVERKVDAKPLRARSNK